MKIAGQRAEALTDEDLAIFENEDADVLTPSIPGNGRAVQPGRASRSPLVRGGGRPPRRFRAAQRPPALLRARSRSRAGPRAGRRRPRGGICARPRPLAGARCFARRISSVAGARRVRHRAAQLPDRQRRAALLAPARGDAQGRSFSAGLVSYQGTEGLDDLVSRAPTTASSRQSRKVATAPSPRASSTSTDPGCGSARTLIAGSSRLAGALPWCRSGREQHNIARASRPMRTGSGLRRRRIRELGPVPAVLAAARTRESRSRSSRAASCSASSSSRSSSQCVTSCADCAPSTGARSCVCARRASRSPPTGAIYIWGVNNGHVIETSLGYFINPLLTIGLGVVILRERLRIVQWAAVALGLVAVTVLELRLRASAVDRTRACRVPSGRTATSRKASRSRRRRGCSSKARCSRFRRSSSSAHSRSRERDVGGPLRDRRPPRRCSSQRGRSRRSPLLFFAGAATRLPLSTMGLLQYLTPGHAVCDRGAHPPRGHVVRAALRLRACLVRARDPRRRRRPAPLRCRTSFRVALMLRPPLADPAFGGGQSLDLRVSGTCLSDGLDHALWPCA